ncbi:MAG: glycosyltransferase family 4 protein [Hyellaceae cyanobacterium CSU_1_1]|nr:glycosyltransferase family 4 protein [Hyellaceae cyanobacterium CSU_1_1]
MKLSFVNQPWTIAAPPPGIDSTGIWSYQVGNYLAKYGDVIYYGSENNLDSKQFFKRSLGLARQIEYIEYQCISLKLDYWLKIPRKIVSVINFKSMLPYFGSAWFNFGYGWQIAKDAARRNCDIIHIHNFSQFVPIIRDRNPEAKIVLHLHCEWVNRLDRKAIASRLAHADLVIGCSDYITNKIKTRFPEYAGICKTINNGVDANHFVPDPQYRPQQPKTAPKLLFVGRISPEKGLHDLIDAFIKITEEYPQAILTIAGPHLVIVRELLCDIQPEPEVQALKDFYSIDYLEHIKSKIPAHLTSQVIFTGSLRQPELLPYYQQADIVINPSLSEAFGMSLVEAMATETPVIATKIGGMPEIVDDQVTGLLVEPANPQELADAAVQLISNPERARKMGTAGRKKVKQHYTWAKIAESLVNTYAAIGVELEFNDTQKAVARSLS